MMMETEMLMKTQKVIHFRLDNQMSCLRFLKIMAVYTHINFLITQQLIRTQIFGFRLDLFDLSDESQEDYLFTDPVDDDGDGLADEDGYPVSEQDYISYYYDYSPFPNGYTGDRDWGSSSGTNKHFPLNVRIRQLSYQWSFDYIKNLVYVEFNITNMNSQDTLYDCAMGIYMDCDIGPQA